MPAGTRQIDGYDALLFPSILDLGGSPSRPEHGGTRSVTHRGTHRCPHHAATSPRSLTMIGTAAQPQNIMIDQQSREGHDVHGLSHTRPRPISFLLKSPDPHTIAPVPAFPAYLKRRPARSPVGQHGGHLEPFQNSVFEKNTAWLPSLLHPRDQLVAVP